MFPYRKFLNFKSIHKYLLKTTSPVKNNYTLNIFLFIFKDVPRTKILPDHNLQNVILLCGQCYDLSR